MLCNQNLHNFQFHSFISFIFFLNNKHYNYPMKLLILPSQRLLYYQGKLELTLLPQEVKAEDYTVHSSNG